MRLLINFFRYFVGFLFIFSGLIKANDPLGLSYKMQEFFEVWGWQQFNATTLWLSISMNVLEIVAGFALIIGWQVKWVMRLLLALIVFFTFLTGYAFLSGKFKSCGCFGDCLPLSPLQSFLKDVLLALIIILLIVKQNFLAPILTTKKLWYALFTVTFLSLGIQLYALKYLPFIDCLPYKAGNNIIEKMKIPEGAKPDSFAITFKYKRNGEIIEFDDQHFPNNFDSTYEFIERFDKLITKGNAVAPIADFGLQTTNFVDTTLSILNKDSLYIFLLVKNFDDFKNWMNKDFVALQKMASSKKVPIFLVTADKENALKYWQNTEQILLADYTVLKSFGRANPTLVLMKQANILSKKSFADVNTFTKNINNYLQ